MNYTQKTLIILLIAIYWIINPTNKIFANDLTISSFKNLDKKYQAVVTGKIVNKKVKQKEGHYYTEYKLKVKDWIYKKDAVKKTDKITIRIYGAELKKQGVAISYSLTPSYIPFKEESIFFLELTSANHPDIFTITKNGIIYGNEYRNFISQHIGDNH